MRSRSAECGVRSAESEKGWELRDRTEKEFRSPGPLGIENREIENRKEIELRSNID